MTIQIFTTGGTIDKVYFDAKSEFQVGDSVLREIFTEANVAFDYQIESLMRKDSLDITDADRWLIRNKVQSCEHKHILITHGTDTMADTAEAILHTGDKTVVLTGALQPARLKATDAIFNIGFAVAVIQTLPAGVFVCMNGCIFKAGHVKKNREAGRFEPMG